MSPVLRRHDRLVLEQNRVPARAHSWPGDPSAAQIILLDPTAVPTADDFLDWGRQLAAQGVHLMRTGALAPRQAAQAEAAAMRCIQELTLLEALPPLAADFATSGLRTRRCRDGRFGLDDFEAIAEVDGAAFGELWRLDASLLADVCTATPAYRARVVRSPSSDTGVWTHRRQPVGFLLSGRAARIGYIQRLAVHPEFQRRGIAAALLSDALVWMRRAGVDRVFVNTHIDNLAALGLYHAHGFHDLPDRLRVFEGSTAS